MKKVLKQPRKQNKGGKKKYRVRNWKEYNKALVDRGRVIFWITEEVLRLWEEKEQPTQKRKRGKPRVYSNIAIETALMLQQVLHMNLRQTEGFVATLLEKTGSTHTSPDYSTLSLRAQTLPISLFVRPIRKEPLHIVVDSTGAKVYGEGEWKVRMYGWSKHRTWKKLHIGVDEKSGDILMGEVTGNDTADCEMLKPLLQQLPCDTAVHQVSADGGYDKHRCYEALARRAVPRIAIPPQHNAKIWRHGNARSDRLPRDENLRRIRSVGRKAWKQEMNYHRRSLVEAAMFRLKTMFSDKVQARSHTNQRVQLLLRCKALNRMTALGMPKSYVVG